MAGWVRNCTCELIATFLLTFIGAGAILTTTWSGQSAGLLIIALAHGVVLSIAVSATMNISGGHVNPAVTICMIVTGRIGAFDGMRYIFAQCLGAGLAGFLLTVVFNALGTGAAGMTGTEAIAACKLGTPFHDTAMLSSTMAVVVEVVLTFILLFAVLGTAVDPRAPKIGGFGIGLAVGVDILMGGPLTGAAMNPARTLGTALFAGDSAVWAQHWVYWVGPVAGAVIAGLVYDAFIFDRTQK